METVEKRTDHAAGLMSVKSVCSYLDLSRSTWLKLVSTGKAPQPIRITGTKNVRWKAEQVRQWLEVQA